MVSGVDSNSEIQHLCSLQISTDIYTGLLDIHRYLHRSVDIYTGLLVQRVTSCVVASSACQLRLSYFVVCHLSSKKIIKVNVTITIAKTKTWTVLR